MWLRYEQDALILVSTGSTQEDPSWRNRKIVDWDVKNQIKQTNHTQHFKTDECPLENSEEPDLNCLH